MCSLLGRFTIAILNAKSINHPKIFTLVNSTQTLPLFRVAFRYYFSQDVGQSKYYRPRVPIQLFLSNNSIEYTEAATTYRAKYCPFCSKPHNNQRSNFYTLNINKESGVFFCFRCSAKGSWLDFQKRVLGIKVDSAFDFQSEEGNYTRSPGVSPAKISDVEYFLYKRNMDGNEYNDVHDYLKSRGFTEQTISAFNLGAGMQRFYNDDGYDDIRCIYFPMYRVLRAEEEKQKLLNSVNQVQNDNIYHYRNNWTEIVKVKIRGAYKEHKHYMKQSPSSSNRGFFGLNLVSPQDKEIIITEGEYDAMAVFQKTGRAALSLPQGATNIPDNLLPYLDRFEKIILWMDNDTAGRINAPKIAYKLGLSRTYLVQHTKIYKDANDFLKNQPELIPVLLASARTVPDQSILKFGSMMGSVRVRIFRQKQNNGMESSWFKYFNRKVKGLRQSQLTIVSGPTGSGKTTFLSQMSLDMCERGMPVIWGSFEIKNEILMTQMLIQHSQVNLFKHKEKFQHYAAAFSKLPLFFLNFYGSTDIEKVLSTVTYSIEKYNIGFVVIDTLQFLLSDQGEGFRKFQIQDSLMSRLRKITTDFNVHIAVVIHPRKTDDGEDIGIHSIYGTSKAAQEADNIWIIQNREGFKLFDIKKNRHDGELGRTPLGFNKEIKNFFEFKRHEFQKLRNNQKTINEIIQSREALTPEDQYAYEVAGQEIDDSQLLKRRQKWNPQLKKR